jgi:hypothetical protein
MEGKPKDVVAPAEVAAASRSGQREYTIVLRGRSAVVFPEAAKPAILIDGISSPFGVLRVSYTTRYIDRGNGIRVPGHLVIEVRAKGESLNAVAQATSNVAISLLPIIALAGNAAIRKPTMELVYESSPGNHEREYLQAHVPAEGSQLHEARALLPHLALRVIAAILQSAEAERHLRATTQYQLALENWHGGNEILVAAHLWMATEALTKVIERRLCREGSRLTRDELATSLGLSVRELDPHIRLTHIQAGDVECYRAIQRASNAFEHSFESFEEIRRQAAPAIRQFGANVRRAILTECEIPEEDMRLLLDAPFDIPLPDHPVVEYLRGTIAGPHDGLARAGNLYPHVGWTVRQIHKPEDGDKKVGLSHEYTFSNEIAEGVVFKPVKFEVWRP